MLQARDLIFLDIDSILFLSLMIRFDISYSVLDKSNSSRPIFEIKTDAQNQRKCASDLEIFGNVVFCCLLHKKDLIFNVCLSKTDESFSRFR